jgi:hypothetical protein
VERSHGELRTRFTDGLSSHDADWCSDLHRLDVSPTL